MTAEWQVKCGSAELNQWKGFGVKGEVRGCEPSAKCEAGLGVQVWPAGMLEPAMKHRSAEARHDHKEKEPSAECWNRHWASE